ncbi:unnamed protein product [Bursaphelenchus xylophilus]|uniref:(pine wood nematode) hypothetical protein n=1 Tax=Bursaphelenchus xylophilus TaxID=6326 RepID=A0A1I7RRX6_BURXY|nr:unnamed protein product [Bursaphelenchus xylophilus]CAG9123409.1 unnamed protein product [Bursaphelenchus xylophilus]
MEVLDSCKMHVDALKSIADFLELPVSELQSETLRQSILPDIQKFSVKDGRNKYEVYFLDENGEFGGYLNYTGSLAGFYNSRYLFEWIKHKKLTVPTGRYRCYIRNSFKSIPNNRFIILLLQIPSVETIQKTTLEVEEVFKIVDVLTELHGANVPPKAIDTVNKDNYILVQGFYSVFLKHQVNRYLEEILNRYSEVFIHPEITLDKLVYLYKSFLSLEYAFSTDPNVQKVFCHGNLSPENINFDQEGNVALIKGWENCHFGDPIEDLAYLMLSSLDKHQRRPNVMKILKRYYYKMVDSHKTPCTLQILKASYLRYLKYFVFFNLLSIWQHLNDPDVFYKTKVTLVRRWNDVVEECYSYEKGEYHLEEEQF